MGSLFPKGLPDYPAASLRQRLLKARSVRAVIWFDDHWTPHSRVLAGRLPVIGFARRTLRTLRRCLKPVFVRAGLPVRVTPTVPRPRAVELSVVLILQVLIAPLVFFAVVFAIIQVTLSRQDNILAEILGDISGLVVLAVLMNLVLLAVVVFLWMWRVWSGGPLAVAVDSNPGDDRRGHLFGLVDIARPGVRRDFRSRFPRIGVFASGGRLLGDRGMGVPGDR
ncbi:hypothetical protein ACFWPH_19905 [Nocardia sp. NPDC058499]|uniref:hypothetical protein n=1 Tax=Nocardia sp. NPDC058499 TaxID=3346530 RepID=UPI003662D10E